MLQRMFAALAFTLAMALGLPSLAQAGTDATAPKDPTIQQIYEAANGGRMSDADAMIAKVLKDHPDSAKAHFVHAELLAAEGRLDGARSELAKAKALSPGLDFAKPEAVERLTNKLDRPAPQTRNTSSRLDEPAPAPLRTESRTISVPWMPIALLGLLVVGYLAFRKRVAPPAAPAQPSYGPAPGPQGMPAGYGSYGSGPGWTPAPPPAASPGMGLGSALATGAAVGVGAVVAQEAVRHWMHDRSDNSMFDRDSGTTTRMADSGNTEMGRSLWPSSSTPSTSQERDRFVDNDFGIKDTSSWDDASSSGGGSFDSDSGSSDNDW
ncbi:hypothetical protein EJP67_22385 [Variovorax guangxiensis]|uniref:Tetratricopeptide repeat protein n=1 Tax=Variovorax guangxiensis TaxID=1775474 RepID=A0A3S0ZH30_9BURK|nr:tetratricopeptide repeat protein [Variovorax guangxiensis]RUR69809.1 hypothetical protein EJP67_22385 [Variovorax guangxiensis]